MEGTIPNLNRLLAHHLGHILRRLVIIRRMEYANVTVINNAGVPAIHMLGK